MSLYFLFLHILYIRGSMLFMDLHIHTGIFSYS